MFTCLALRNILYIIQLYNILKLKYLTLKLSSKYQVNRTLFFKRKLHMQNINYLFGIILVYLIKIMFLRYV